MTETVFVTPPLERYTKANGRTYHAIVGQILEVPEFDAEILLANGWHHAGEPGTSSPSQASNLTALANTPAQGGGTTVYEGTFTPVLEGSSGSATHLIQKGHWRKIGGIVDWQAEIYVQGAGTLAGPLRITGIPTTDANAGNLVCALDAPCSFKFANSLGVVFNNTQPIQGVIPAGLAYIFPYTVDANTGAVVQFNATSLDTNGGHYNIFAASGQFHAGPP